jgi:hypothetical protein
VFSPVQRLPLALRLTLLGLAMFSVLARPMYSTWCETHQIGHELAELSHEEFRPDSGLERELDVEHARGEHGLLHSDDGGVYAGTAAVVTVPAVHVVSVMNPLKVVLPDPAQRINRLFRPPIV